MRSMLMGFLMMLWASGARCRPAPAAATSSALYTCLNWKTLPPNLQLQAAAPLYRCTLVDGLVKALVAVRNVPCACSSMTSDLQAPSSQPASPVGMLPNPFNVRQSPNADQLNLQGEGMRRYALL